MGNGIVKVETPVSLVKGFDGFTVIGDPGCDGLGAGIMAVFAAALDAAGDGPALVLGDLVPTGTDRFYDSVAAFVAGVARGPVYLLAGNHDTGAYERHAGRRDYAVAGDRLLVVCLDDSKRSFAPESIAFLEETLAAQAQPDVVVAFHIPPPNAVCGNSCSAEAWAALRAALEPHRARVRFLLSGHVHSFFQTVVDGYPLLVSGGGGARIEYVSEAVDPALALPHVLTFAYDAAGALGWTYRPLDGVPYDRELADARIRAALEAAFRDECVAHLTYRFAAEDAAAKGYPGVAALYRAAADAEAVHARNHRLALGAAGTLRDGLAAAVRDEQAEVAVTYREAADYAASSGYGLAAYGFHDALEAEAVHHALFTEALAAVEAGRDIPAATYWTCSSCGYTFRADEAPGRCPVCGAPQDKIFRAP